MIFYALVASDSDFAIDLWPTREQAEHELRKVLADEPDFIDLLSIIGVDLSVLRAQAERGPVNASNPG